MATANFTIENQEGKSAVPEILRASQLGEHGLDVDRVCIDPRWALRLPASLAQRRRLLPLSELGGIVYVACIDSKDSQTQKTVEKLLQIPCTLVQAEANSLQRALDRVYQSLTLGERRENSAAQVARNHADDPVALCDSLFQAAVIRGASDIHLVPNEHSLSVHFRVDGVLEWYCNIDKPLQPSVLSRLKVVAGMDIAEKRTAQDGRITTYFAQSDRKIEIRAASLPTRFGERLTLRLLANNTAGLTLQSLGMCESDLHRFCTASEQPHGLVLLTGPTGSGKSTTLYVAIERLLKSRGGNVITIEDPVEYEIPGASQVEIDSADKVNFSKALRGILRHDPDVVMIGEIRDHETADTAIKAALTGHLVFSTVHTNTAAGVVTRLIDMGVEKFLVAATLRLSVAQRLVRRLCVSCRRERVITQQESILLNNSQLAGLPTFDPTGCLACSGKGFAGRIGLFEMIENSDETAQLINNSSNELLIAKDAKRRGCRTLLEDGIDKILSGATTVSEVVSAVVCG